MKEICMLHSKRFLFLVVVFAILPMMLMGQSQDMTVEESYLQESVEIMIIREQSRAENRDMKMVALEYIGDVIGRGNKGEEVHAALEFLSLEGVLNITRENGRVMNNYPDVRAKAATYLGQLGSTEARDTLVKMVSVDNEPMVLTEAIKSLATIGINDNNDTVNAILWTFNRFDHLRPDNLLALSTIEAFEKLSASAGGIKDPAVIQTLARIAESGNYIRPVRIRARLLLDDLLVPKE